MREANGCKGLPLRLTWLEAAMRTGEAGRANATRGAWVAGFKLMVSMISGKEFAEMAGSKKPAGAVETW